MLALIIGIIFLVLFIPFCFYMSYLNNKKKTLNSDTNIFSLIFWIY